MGEVRGGGNFAEHTLQLSVMDLGPILMFYILITTMANNHINQGGKNSNIKY